MLNSDNAGRSCLLLLLLGEVALVVEVAEEDYEGEEVGADDGVHGVREVALGVEVVERVGG